MYPYPYSGLQAESTRSELKYETFIESVIQSVPFVQFCTVLSKSYEIEGEAFIAFIVASTPISDAQLHKHLESRLPAHLFPQAFVYLTTLPLTPEGLVDRQALDRIEIIDGSLVQAWENQLLALEGVEQAVVIEAEPYEKLVPLHLSDVIPGWDMPTSSKVPAVDPSISTKQISVLLGKEVLSMSQGVPLQIPKAFSGTIIDFLLSAAADHPDHGIVYIQDDGASVFQGYEVLKQEAGKILSGLRQLGLKPQDKVLFQLEHAQDFLPAFWGCILGGVVPVPLSVTASNRDKNNAARKLEQAWQQLNCPLVLTSQSQLREVCAAGQTFANEDFKAASIEALRSHQPDLNWHQGQPDDVALLLLTSGSTGVPKAVMQSHHSIISLTSGFIQMHDFTDQDICVNWMPLDHVGGIVMCHLRDTHLGSQQVQVPTDFILQKPLRWLDLIDQYRATFTWAPNFAYELINNLVQDATQKNWDLSSMRFMLTGGEAVSAKTSRATLKRLSSYGLPATAIRPAWGMSETCSGIVFSDNFNLDVTQDGDQFVEVGLPMPGFAMRITNAQNQVVPEHTIGYLEVKGPTVTSGYFQNDSATQSSFTADGWFKTGDLAVLKNGRLTITGREKDIIIINGVNFHSHEVEEVVQEISSVESSYTAACAVRIAGDNSDKLAIFFNPKENLSLALPILIQEIREKVSTNMGINPHYLIPVKKETVPKTSIGKIQRSQLKQRFEEGEFNSIIKQLDIAEENSNTIPPWFFNKSWHQKEIINLMPSIKKGSSLIFADKLGLGVAIHEELTKNNQEFVLIDSGNNFEKISRTHYVVNPTQSQDYIDLIQHLTLENISIAKVFHLWAYDELIDDQVYDLNKLNLDLEQGIYSLLFLVQALDKYYLSKAFSVNQIDLLVVSSYCQSVWNEEPLAPGKATVLGLIKALSKEIGWLNCRHVDTPSTFNRDTAKSIIKELSGTFSEQEVCYRSKKRFVPVLQKINVIEEKKNRVPLKKDGFYLISGGLGGVGIEMTRYLLEEYQAKVLLVGRSSIVTLENDKNLLNNSSTDSIKSKKYIELQKLPGEIQYQSIDICNVSHLQETIKHFESHWNTSLDGIIHLAGVYQENVVLEETKDSIASVLEPKVLGTLSLHQLLKNRPDCLFIQFSSVTGFFGGSMIGAYAAANCFQECFSHFQKRMQLQSYCFNWSSWRNTGMSQSSVAGEALAARGYQLLSVKQGLNAFLAGLCTDQTVLMIGLDSNNRSIRQSMQKAPYVLKALTAYLKTTNNRLPDNLSKLEVKDRYQTISTCHFQILKEIPVTQTGEIDYEALRFFRTKNTSKKIEPSSEVELRLAAIWKNLLCIDQIGVNDNFFAIGGSSLLGVQLLNRIEEELSIKLSPSILFEAPTIAQQAQFVQSNVNAQKNLLLNHQDNSPSDSSILLLKAGNTNTPLFFAPGGGAVDVDFLMYPPLFQNLDKDQSVYILEARSFDSDGNRYIRVEDMAKDYADEIQLIQPQEPYALGGECIGGILALEIGRQLQERGHKVALITMLDTGAPQKDTYARHLIRSQYKIFNHKLNQYINRAKKVFHSQEKNTVTNTENQLSNSSLEVIQQAALKGRKSYNIKEKNFRVSLMFRHQPKLYDGNITLLLNEARFHERYTEKTGPEWTDHIYKNDSSLGWRKIVKQGVEIQVVPGNHNSYIREYSRETAKILQSCINKAKEE
jgi:acyl-CoA synthetase (AMP-forming)/AMP-acid ligase II/thioesterase domain-containing protein/NADP-dependent 3-hydroxy acid dehydrogenase YdfG/acyl carrier protein